MCTPSTSPLGTMTAPAPAPAPGPGTVSVSGDLADVTTVQEGPRVKVEVSLSDIACALIAKELLSAPFLKVTEGAWDMPCLCSKGVSSRMKRVGDRDFISQADTLGNPYPVQAHAACELPCQAARLTD